MGVGQAGDNIEENLEDQVRKKAIEIAASYVADGYSEEEAFQLAEIEAREWAEGKR